MNKFPDIISVFPLSNFIMFPHTTVPLNIFEPRYIQMVDAALASPNRLIGMIQPSSSETKGMGNLKKVGCVGRISSFNEAEDSRYLITLTGVCRFEIEEELDTTPTRGDQKTEKDDRKTIINCIDAM